MDIIQEVEQELSTGSEMDLAGALISIGKHALVQYRPLVLKSMSHAEPEVRAEALKVLTFYWKEKEFEVVARGLIDSEETESNRENALWCWESYHRGNANPKVLKELAHFASDPRRPIKFRAQAVYGFFYVLKFARYPAEFPESLSDALYTSKSKEEFENLVPWEILRPYLSV